MTTLRFQGLEDMVKAIGLPREKLCLYCWTGRCPSQKEVVKRQKPKKKSGKK